jgi:hypothetical protein
MKELWKNIVLVTAGILLLILFYNYPAPKDRILNIQNYLITVSGIISALVIVGCKNNEGHSYQELGIKASFEVDDTTRF